MDFLDNFRLQDAVDIGIVAFIVYSLIELIRGTRAARMLIGLCIVVLIYLSSRVFDLYTVNWILDNFLSSVLLVIVIIFQHDIRRALVHFGRAPFFKYLRRVEPDEDSIASFEYPVSRPLYFYVKNDHRKIVPGLDEFVKVMVSDDSIGAGGFNEERGLTPLAPNVLKKWREAAEKGYPMKGL